MSEKCTQLYTFVVPVYNPWWQMISTALLFLTTVCIKFTFVVFVGIGLIKGARSLLHAVQRTSEGLKRGERGEGMC